MTQRLVLVLGLVTLSVAAAGCGGKALYTAAPTLSCLEQNRVDVVRELGDHVGFRTGNSARLFFAPTTAESDKAERVLHPSVAASGQFTRKRNVFAAWHRKPSASDIQALESCLRSKDSGDRTNLPLPVRPLGCVKIYFESSAKPAQLAAVRARLKANQEVRSFRFVSREAAFAAMKKKFPELTKSLLQNPLPDAFEAQPQRGRYVRRIAQSFRGIPGVEHVNFGDSACW